MKTNILLPKRLKVGFKNRPDTYNGLLAYLIYYDEKGKLRKEPSWNDWRDLKIEPQELDNVPTSGFVLNKKVGGYKSDWNFRQAYTRVFDPRGFEFEITIPNLLYILENTSCIKGKGLEGDFVYCWDKVDLVLLPTSAPEYSKIVSFTEMVTDKEKITKKNVVLGGIYKTNKDEEWVYLGHFDKYSQIFNEKNGRPVSQTTYRSIGKRHFFKCISKIKDDSYANRMSDGFRFVSGLSNLVKTVSDKPHPEYAAMMDKLERQVEYSPLDPSKDKYIPTTTAQLEKSFARRYERDLFIEVDGIMLSCTVDNYQGYGIYDVQRVVNPESLFYKKEDPYYKQRGHGREFYWDAHEDTELLKIKRSMGLRESHWGYQQNKKEPTLAELNAKYSFMTRKRFLQNGKPFRED